MKRSVPAASYAEWHPCCTSVLDRDGERVDVSALPREEWVGTSLSRCEYVDLTVSWIEDVDWPEHWQCPECGGTSFEGVHRDYAEADLEGGSVSSEIDDEG